MSKMNDAAFINQYYTFCTYKRSIAQNEQMKKKLSCHCTVKRLCSFRYIHQIALQDYRLEDVVYFQIIRLAVCELNNVNEESLLYCMVNSEVG